MIRHIISAVIGGAVAMLLMLLIRPSLFRPQPAAAPAASQQAKSAVAEAAAPDHLPEPLILRVYDVRDLITRAAEFDRAIGVVRPATPPAEGIQWSPLKLDREEYETALVQLVMECCDPECWRQAGGSQSCYGIFGFLVVQASPEVHEKVARLLTELRRGCMAAPTTRGSYVVANPEPWPRPTTRSTLPALPLNTNLKEVLFDKTTLKDAVEILRIQAGANIVVRWNEIAPYGVHEKTEITLTARNLPLWRVLDLLMKESRGHTAPLAWCAEEGVIVITTTEAVRGIEPSSNIRLYDVRRLLAHAAEFRRAATRRATSCPAIDANDPAADLIDLIESTVACDSWRIAGGTAAIRSFSGILVIQQMEQHHNEIQRFLDALTVKIATPPKGNSKSSGL